MMIATYDKVAALARSWSKNNLVQSFFQHEDPDYLAILEMGENAVPFLFQLMLEAPDTIHLCYHAIPKLINPPQDIVEKMNGEAISKQGGFVGLDVRKMEEIYAEWGKELGFLTEEECWTITNRKI